MGRNETTLSYIAVVVARSILRLDRLLDEEEDPAQPLPPDSESVPEVSSSSYHVLLFAPLLAGRLERLLERLFERLLFDLLLFVGDLPLLLSSSESELSLDLASLLDFRRGLDL